MKRKKVILYQPICRRCHFVVKATTDLQLIKMRMEDHYEHSHGYASTFVSNVPLNDFKELFKIIRTVNPSPAEVAQLRMAQERPAYYRVQRLPKIKIPLVSAQSSGE